jgi:hypothetical protein
VEGGWSEFGVTDYLDPTELGIGALRIAALRIGALRTAQRRFRSHSTQARIVLAALAER